MKMAKPSERDIDAAGNLMSLLDQIDRGDYPCLDKDKDVPDWFDEDNVEHLRAFYDAVKSTLDQGPGYPGRVIGGMCYVIMYDKNEIIDPSSDTIDLHPKLVRALEAAEQAAPVAAQAGQVAVPEGWQAAIAEVAKATRKFPTWPTDPLHAVAVLGEEFGELTKAVLQTTYEPHKVQDGELRTEAIQTAAMALRFLASLDCYEFNRCAQHAQGIAAAPSPAKESK